MSVFRIDTISHHLDNGLIIDIYIIVGQSGVILRSFETRKTAELHLKGLLNRLNVLDMNIDRTQTG